MKISKWLCVGFLAGVLPLGACSDLSGIFDVESPGKIADEDLNAADAVKGLVVGMSYDMAEAMADMLELHSLASGELWHGGSYNWGDVPRGIILPEDVDDPWSELHQARWVAESGIERMRQIPGFEDQFASNPFVARAYLFAGLANRSLGELMCDAVIDGSARQPHTVHFERAIDQFTQAITIGQAVGSGAKDIVNAAYGGRAAVKAWTGDWAGAVADAQQVPTSFVYLAQLNEEDPSNDIFYETHTRFEYTVFSTEFEDHPDDPRAPWHIERKADGSIASGANGATPHYMQDKYASLGDDIPLVKGTEMLLLRAEAALRNGNLSQAAALMNEARAFYEMDPLPASATATAEDAWATLHYERGATLWLENRRLWDLRRWFNETGPAHHDFLADRDKCIPVSEAELRSNRNL